VANRKKTWKNS